VHHQGELIVTQEVSNLYFACWVFDAADQNLTVPAAYSDIGECQVEGK
jgi:hypothetical protein